MACSEGENLTIRDSFIDKQEHGIYGKLVLFRKK